MTNVPELADISVRDLAHILGFLAGWVKDGHPISGKKLLCLGQDALVEYLTQCEPLFLDWPLSLYQKIDERLTASDHWLPPEDRFPVIYKGVSRAHKDLYPITRLRPLVTNYLAEAHPEYVARCGDRHGVLEVAARQAGYITLGEAAQLLNSTVRMIKKIAPQARVNIYAAADGGRTQRILKDDLKSLSELILLFRRSRKGPLEVADRFLSKSTAKIADEKELRLHERVDSIQIGEMLGVSAATAARIRRDKLIGSDTSEGVTAPATRQCVEEYLTALEISCVPCDDPNLIPITTLARKNAAYWRVGFRAALSLVRDGKLLVRAVDQTELGLRRILVSDRDLRALNDSLQRG